MIHSGGAGYLLDTKALAVLRDNIDTPKCFPTITGKGRRNESIMG